MPLSQLPSEICVQVLECLSPHNLLAIIQTCHYLFNIAEPILYNICIRDELDSTLEWAAKSGSLNTVKRLEAAGVDVFSLCSKLPLIGYAAGHSHIHLVSYLVPKAGPYNLWKSSGIRKPMYSAVGYPTLLSLLVNHVKNDDDFIKEISECLVSAAAEREDSCRILLEAGAMPEVEYFMNWSLLSYLIRFGKPAIARLLLQYGAKLRQGDKLWTKCLWYHWCNDFMIKEERSFEYVQLLLDYGLEVTEDAIWYATSWPKPDILELLLQQDQVIPDFEKPVGKYKHTMLHNAVMYKSYNVAKFLVEHGVDIEARTKDQLTPLILAARRHQIDIVKLLMGVGADIDARDSKGMSALDTALKYSGDKMAAVLREYGAK